MLTGWLDTNIITLIQILLTLAGDKHAEALQFHHTPNGQHYQTFISSVRHGKLIICSLRQERECVGCRMVCCQCQEGNGAWRLVWGDGGGECKVHGHRSVTASPMWGATRLGKPIGSSFTNVSTSSYAFKDTRSECTIVQIHNHPLGESCASRDRVITLVN